MDQHKRVTSRTVRKAGKIFHPTALGGYALCQVEHAGDILVLFFCPPNLHAAVLNGTNQNITSLELDSLEQAKSIRSPIARRNPPGLGECRADGLPLARRRWLPHTLFFLSHAIRNEPKEIVRCALEAQGMQR
jgi:hypothetical protein